jgi:hypothetical protein
MISAQGGQVLTFTIIVVNWFSFQFFSTETLWVPNRFSVGTSGLSSCQKGIQSKKSTEEPRPLVPLEDSLAP